MEGTVGGSDAVWERITSAVSADGCYPVADLQGATVDLQYRWPSESKVAHNTNQLRAYRVNGSIVGAFSPHVLWAISDITLQVGQESLDPVSPNTSALMATSQ